jgi:hypothetical protein
MPIHHQWLVDIFGMCAGETPSEILVIGGAATLLTGLWFASRAIIVAGDAVNYEMQRALSQ